MKSNKYTGITQLFLLLTLSLLFIASKCSNPSASPNPEKITFDLSQIDEDGLAGQNPGGKVAIDYEYCIPADEEIAAAIRQIDPSLKIMKNSKGRIGCTGEQWLCLGNTHQKKWREILMNLTRLEFISKIDRNFFE